MKFMKIHEIILYKCMNLYYNYFTKQRNEVFIMRKTLHWRQALHWVQFPK